MQQNLRGIFNRRGIDQQRFDRIFIRQPDDFSCTPASFATAARIYGLDPGLDFTFLRKALKTDFDGTDSPSMAAIARKHFPVQKVGHHLPYKGGIALGVIHHKPDGDLHSMVFLDRRGDTVIYYDPFDHRIFRDRVTNMERPGRWLATLPAVAGVDFDFWDKAAVDNPFKLRQQAFWMKARDIPFRP